MAKIGAMVVGQSPRPDVEAEFLAAAGGSLEIDLRGALDGLSREEINRIPPSEPGDTLFTRLPSGDGVEISKRAVVQRGEEKLARMVEEGHDVVVVLCTGTFPEWVGKYPVVFPSKIMASLVEAVYSSGTLGVFTPLPAQAAKTEVRWQSAGYETVVCPLSPNADDVAATAAAEIMKTHAPTLLVFDCISYTSKTKRLVCDIVGVPGILGVTAAARVAGELVS